MKIAYVCHWNPFAEDGVVKKIAAQAGVWRRCGAEVGVFCVGPASADPQPMTLEGRAFLYRRPLTGRFVATRSLVRAATEWRPDVVYLRYSVFFPPPVALMRRVPTVVEVNSNDRREYRLGSPRVALYNELNRRLVLGAAAGFSFVTGELASAPEFARWRTPAVVIGNGVDLTAAEPLPPARNDRRRLVFLAGSPGPWHGVDKMVWLARALPDLDFELVGVESWDDEKLPPNVTLHPRLARADYEKILRRSDVALGTLALHRNSMNETPPLKVREYLLYGLPVITAHADPDLRGSLWFVLQLPNSESNVRDHLAEIRRFVAEVAGKRVPRDLVAARIDLVAKETERFKFLERVASGTS